MRRATSRARVRFSEWAWHDPKTKRPWCGVKGNARCRCRPAKTWFILATLATNSGANCNFKAKLYASMTVDPEKPILLYVLPPREGHMRPALQITSHLIARGFDITILGVTAWKDAITSAGAHFAPMIGLWATLDDLTSPKSRWKPILDLADNPKEMRRQLTAALSHKVLPTGLESVRNALTEIRHRYSASWEGRTVVILSDTCFSGTLPLKLGSDRPPGYQNINLRTVGIGVVPQFWASSSRPPWGVGLPYDPTEAGVQRNLKVYAEEWDQEAEDRARWVCEALNCDETVDDLFLRHDEEGVKGA